jgi:subfamily B ATP-binding cassette protein MsbA
MPAHSGRESASNERTITHAAGPAIELSDTRAAEAAGGEEREIEPTHAPRMTIFAAQRSFTGMWIYRRLLGYARPHRAVIAAAIGAAVASAAAAALYAYLAGPLLKAVLTQAPAKIPGFSDRGNPILAMSLALVAVAAFKAGAQFIQNGLMQAAGQQVISRMRSDLYRHLLELPPRFFERRHTGELLSRFTSDVAQVEFAVTQALASYLKDLLQIAALLIVCLAVDWRLFVAAFVLLPGAALAVARFARVLRKISTKAQARLGRLSELLAEQLQNLPVVQGYRAFPRSLAQFDREQEDYLASMRRSLLVRGTFTPTLELLGILGIASVIGLGARAVSAEPDLAAKLLSFVAAALLMYQPIKSLSGTFSSVVQGVGSAERLFEIADQKSAPEEGAEAFPLRRELRFEAVRASYDGVREVLRGVSLAIPAGSRVAIVGPSGAGKTTLFSILLRFLAPSAGLVKWDGVELAQFRPESLRALLAWVPQEPVLFSGTVRQNLLFGRPEATDRELWNALEQAHAGDFVRGFPHGLEEPVGERGGMLSGGQRQRLAIARAFLRQPSLLLLDEPTSALDAVSEREVQAGLAELMRGRTTIVIAHRLATVRSADLIYVLDQGAIVETGTHDDLVALRGRYAALLQQGEMA